MTHYLAPESWRTDGYRDVVDDDDIGQQYDTWSGEGCWDSEDDARSECELLAADNIVDACVEAHDRIGDDINPDARQAYGYSQTPLW